MPISDTDVLVKYSTKSGSQGSTLTGVPTSSLGLWISTTEIPNAIFQNLFPTLTGDENAASVVHYLCVFVHNNHGTLTLLTPRVWITDKTSGATLIAIGLDPTSASLYNSSVAQALSVGTILNAPVGVTFTTPTSKSTGLTLGDLAPGQVRPIWIRRTAANTGALAVDSFKLKVEGDTGA